MAGGVTTAQILPGSANNIGGCSTTLLGVYLDLSCCIGGQSFVIKLRPTAERSPTSKVIKKKVGKLSNKDKKKLDDRDMRTEGKVWKKGRAERDGKGALLAQKGKKKVKGGKPASKMEAKGKFGKKR